ncbi:serine/threonine protein kinase [Saccharothrix violaceirubra]|uniref:non-specific serine/threonine protein kinase n=1 Tax=Saccharothrix violaceirubra TaxID=413306 RepID=A0A7W7SY61_9PSEU|nr:serine/threonine protein kinase [Saccharothrix violaceirubra]
MDTERLIGGRYRLRHVLGRGSMGTVWAAHDEVLRRAVAVKEMLHPPGTPEPEAEVLRERTLREARSAAALAHPNLVTLYDVVRHDGEPFVVMELVPSASLAEVVRERGPLTDEQGAVVADAVAAGLEAAHRAGITHRDVKPGNVLVADDGRVKLTDFGIARNVAEATLTSRGITLGTPAFIAPEVAAGGDVSPAADLWSLGATLYAAMTGQDPYEGANVMQTVNQVIHADVPDLGVTGGLEPVIAGLMVKDPQARIPLAEVRRLLVDTLPEPGANVFPSDGPTRPVVEVVRRPPAKPVIAPDTPLASDPGPLPFTLTPERRRPVSKPVVLLALVLFVVASVGGFAATRTLAGTSPLPPATGARPTVSPLPDDLPLQPVRASAAAANGERDTEFGLSVGVDWTQFVEQRLHQILPPSTVVHFVSPDGVYEVTVQKFTVFYPKLTDEDYVKAVAERWGPDRIFGQAVTPSTGGILFSYRTVEQTTSTGPGRGAEPDLRRSRYSRLVPAGPSLWVVEVSFPTDQEEAGRTRLFGPIANSFTVG